MAIITPAQVNSIAFIIPVTENMILPSFIQAAEINFLVPLLSREFYNALSDNPSGYTKLIETFIQPFLAFCVKGIFFNQMITESQVYDIPNQQRIDLLTEIASIQQIMKNELLFHLSTTQYPIIPPSIRNPVNRFGGILT